MSDDEKQEVHGYGNEEARKQIPKLAISVDRSAEIDALQKENAKLTVQLEQLAQKEFEAKCRKHGLNPETTDVETLKQIERENRPAPIGIEGSTAPLNYQQTGQEPETDNEGLPVDMLSFKDEYDMVNQLEKLAEKGDVTAKKALAQLLDKATEKSWEYEYDGSPKELFKSPKTDKERAELAEKRKINWRKVK